MSEEDVHRLLSPHTLSHRECMPRHPRLLADPIAPPTIAPLTLSERQQALFLLAHVPQLSSRLHGKCLPLLVQLVLLRAQGSTLLFVVTKKG